MFFTLTTIAFLIGNYVCDDGQLKATVFITRYEMMKHELGVESLISFNMQYMDSDEL